MRDLPVPDTLGLTPEGRRAIQTLGHSADPARFAEHVGSYRSMTTPVRLLQDGCNQRGDAVPVRDLVEHPQAIRLQGPGETLDEWLGRDPGVQRIQVDIVGGGYPLVFRTPHPRLVVVTTLGD